LRIAQHAEPLTVRKVASGTEIALDECEQGIWYSELKQGRMMQKEKGAEPQDAHAPPDTTEALVKTLNDYQADLFITSGHASERNWQIGYGYRDGQFKCEQGVLFGLDTKGNRFPVQSKNPKVYLPIGNCLMGHIDGTDAMALAFLNSGGVDQMIGYTVTTWYGYAGWGCLDYFVEQPGRYTFNQAFLANQVALIYRLQSCFTGAAQAEVDGEGNTKSQIQTTEQGRNAGLNEMDARGLLNDRDTLAFYGDPAWEARMAKGKTGWNQTLKEKGGLWTFEVNLNLGAKSFDPVNENGSQRGWRPIMEFLPHRVKEVQVIEGADLNPVITDDFILVPHPRTCDPAKKYRVVFRAKPVD
jgi:zinc protease